MLPILWADVKNSICLIYCRAYGLYKEGTRERTHMMDIICREQTKT